MRSLFQNVLLVVFASTALLAQSTGRIEGTVRSSGTNDVLKGITIALIERNKLTSTDKEGSFTFTNLAPGTYSIKASGIGWNAETQQIEVTADKPAVLTFALQESVKNMGEVIVYGASRQPEKLTTAPAAIAVVTPAQLERASGHDQLGKTMEHIVGIDVVQSGSNDFNINARGFNNSINRRMLVLVDGRDPSTPLLNLNEWNSVTSLLGDVSSIEVVRGPGSALYGPNAYNGVVNIRTTDPLEVQGTRINLTGGEWETFRGSIRHAGRFGDFAYKLSFGASTQLNYSIVSRMKDTTKPNNGLEYPGLAYDVRPLTENARNPYAYIGTARLDYHLDPTSRIVSEFGYSNSGNDFYVNQTGRILIQEVSRPFARLAYNSEHINVQAGWQQRYVPVAQLVYNANATSGEWSNVYQIDAQWNSWLMDSTVRVILGAQHEQQFVNTTYDYEIDTTAVPRQSRLPLLSPDDQRGIFTGVYGQAEWQANSMLKVVGAIRVDGSNYYDTQVSPKLALVLEPMRGHTVRATYNHSFLRPSFADFYRKSPAGPPVNLTRVESNVDSITSVIVGESVSSNLNLSAATAQWNLGNPTLAPEKANSFEIGYRATPSEKLFVEVNAYWNQRSNFISNPLGGLAPNVYPPVKSNTGNASYDAIADSILAVELAKINPAYPSRLSEYQGNPTLVVAPRNIAVVDEYGVEVGATYFLTSELSVSANYAYLKSEVQDNEVSTLKILPNTSPHRINGAIEYVKPGMFDAGIQIRYVEGFQWIAGTVEGPVPSYAVVNLNAGYFILPELRVGINAFNLLDRAHYEIFGGTILRRQVTGSVSYTF